MKFKSDIEVQAGLRDGSNDIGTAGQLLSSTGTITNWIDQGDVVAAGATRVLIACKNTSGGTIAKGTPVYQTGNVGATDVIEVAEADALISTGYLPAIGLLETDLINNAFGHVVITGELLNITTDPIDGLTPTTGDTIYLKSGGGLTLTKPTGEGNAIQNLGLVGKVSGGNAGSLTVASIMRQNDVPNLPTGKIWIGDGNTIVSDTVYVDEPNNRVGIGTTSPSYKLEVSGEINAAGGDGYRIEGKPWAAESSNNLKLGDWDGEGFTTTIYDDTSAPVVIVKQGSVGIGTTSPSTKLHVSGGDIRIDDTERLEFGAGGVRINNDAAGRMYQRAPLGYYWETNGGYRMVLNSLGNVGIGTTSPTTKLDVYGNLRLGTTGDFNISQSPFLTTVFYVTGGGNGGTITFGAPAANTQNVSIQGDLWSYQGSIGTKFQGTFNNKISYNGDNYLNSGNLGIGTTNPSARLEVQGTNSNTQAALKVTDSGDSFFEVVPDNNTTFKIGDLDAVGDEAMIVGTFSDITFSKGGTTTMILDSNNRVGIGTTSPSSKLQVNGDLTVGDDSTVGSFINVIAAGASQDAGIRFGSESNTDSKAAIYTNTVNSDLHFDVTETTRMLIDSGTGNVGIGTTGPRSKLHVVGGVKLGNDTDSPSSAKAGTFRYYTSGNNSYVDMCMRTGASTYAWVNIVTNSW